MNLIRNEASFRKSRRHQSNRNIHLGGIIYQSTSQKSFTTVGSLFSGAAEFCHQESALCRRPGQLLRISKKTSSLISARAWRAKLINLLKTFSPFPNVKMPRRSPPLIANSTFRLYFRIGCFAAIFDSICCANLSINRFSRILK
jgi:hypothetical protein